MKTTRTALVLSVFLITAVATEPAYAWGRGRGCCWGAPFVAGALVGGALLSPYYYGGYPYYSPYYYPPYYPPVAPAPSVYIEQPAQQQIAPAAPQQQMQGSWYYCAASHAYYPYVKDCPSGWQRVAPQPG